MGCALYADRPADSGRNWWALAALVFFANAPDLDFIPGLLAGDPHLMHRTATHSLFSPVVVAALAGLAFWWRGRQAALEAARLVFFGVLSHIVLDYFCAPSPAEGPALFWPFLPTRFAASPSVFPLLSWNHILSWGNVVGVIGEAAIVSIFLLVAFMRRSLNGLKAAEEPASSFPMAEAGE